MLCAMCMHWIWFFFCQHSNSNHSFRLLLSCGRALSVRILLFVIRIHSILFWFYIFPHFNGSITIRSYESISLALLHRMRFHCTQWWCGRRLCILFYGEMFRTQLTARRKLAITAFAFAGGSFWPRHWISEKYTSPSQREYQMMSPEEIPLNRRLKKKNIRSHLARRQAILFRLKSKWNNSIAARKKSE